MVGGNPRAAKAPPTTPNQRSGKKIRVRKKKATIITKIRGG